MGFNEFIKQYQYDPSCSSTSKRQRLVERQLNDDLPDLISDSDQIDQVAVSFNLDPSYLSTTSFPTSRTRTSIPIHFIVNNDNNDENNDNEKKKQEKVNDKNIIDDYVSQSNFLKAIFGIPEVPINQVSHISDFQTPSFVSPQLYPKRNDPVNPSCFHHDYIYPESRDSKIENFDEIIVQKCEDYQTLENLKKRELKNKNEDIDDCKKYINDHFRPPARKIDVYTAKLENDIKKLREENKILFQTNKQLNNTLDDIYKDMRVIHELTNEIFKHERVKETGY